MSELTLKEKTATGFFWGGISNLVQQVIGMSFGIVIARILSPDDYGLLAMLTIFTAMANTIMDSGFSIALINQQNTENKDYNAVFWFNIFMALGMYIILFFSAPWIAQFYNQPILIPLSRVLFLTFIFSATGIVHNALLVKKIMAKQRGIIDMAAVFGSGIIGLILALNGLAFWSLVIQQLVQVLVAILLRWYFSPWRPTLDLNLAPLKGMYRFSFTMLLTDFVSQFTHNMLSVVLGHNYGQEQTGYYIQGHKWSSLGYTVFSNMLVGVAQPVLLEAKCDNDERQKKVFRKMLRFGTFLITPIMLGFAFIGRDFIIIFLGEKWLNSLPFLQLFCFFAGVSHLSILCMQLLITRRRTKEITLIIFTTSVITIFSMLLLSSHGIFFLSISYVIVQLISLVGWFFSVRRCINITGLTMVKDVAPYLIATFIVLLLTYTLTYRIECVGVRFILRIVVALSLYLAIMRYGNSVVYSESIGFLLKLKHNG
jgi:hypothetical protein